MPNKLPQGWVECQFSDCIDKISISNKLKQKEYLLEGEYPVIDQGHFFISGYYNERNLLLEIGQPVIIFGDHTRCFKYVDFPFIAGADGIKVLKPKQFFNSKLFYYFCLALKFPNKGYSRHYQYLEKTIMHIPPLNEQRRIVEKIESEFAKIDEGLEHLENAKEQIKQYRQSVLKSAFEGKLYKTSEWEIFNILELCSIINGTTIDKSLEKQFGEIPYIKVSDMNLPENSVKITTSSRFVNKNEIKANTIIPKNSIIFPKRGGAIATNKKRKVIFPIIIDLNIMALIPNNTNILSHEYLYYWLQKLDLSTISNGGAVPQINRYSFENLFLKLPTLEEQKRIVEEIEKRFAVADEVEKVVEENIEKAKQLKQSILKKAFEGRLVPQDPTDEPASILLEKIKQERSKK